MCPSVKAPVDLKRVGHLLIHHPSQAQMHRVTRVLERLLIILFVLVVAAFAYLMLGNKGDTLKLSDEVMDKLSKLDALKS